MWVSWETCVDPWHLHPCCTIRGTVAPNIFCVFSSNLVHLIQTETQLNSASVWLCHHLPHVAVSLVGVSCMELGQDQASKDRFTLLNSAWDLLSLYHTVPWNKTMGEKPCCLPDTHQREFARCVGQFTSLGSLRSHFFPLFLQKCSAKGLSVIPPNCWVPLSSLWAELRLVTNFPRAHTFLKIKSS